MEVEGVQELQNSEEVLHICSCEKVFWKYTTNLQENTQEGNNTVESFIYGKGRWPNP